MTDAGTEQEIAEVSRFERWVEPARPKAELWRTLLGGIIVVVAWAVWTFMVLLFALGAGLVDPDGMQSMLGQGTAELDAAQTIALTCVLLATFLGLWIGVFVAARVLHGRKLAGVVSYEGRLRWSELGWGFAIGAAYLGIGLATSFATGHLPERSSLELNAWLAGFAPICFFLFFQSAGEELFFRGYLVQQFAARFRSPWVWGLVPAVLFGAGHYANVPDPVFAAYYVAATIMFGLIATAIVWRTGSIAASIGLHFANNIGAFTLAGPEGSGPGSQLWIWPEADVVAGAPIDLSTLVLLLAFVLSPWAPFPKGQAFGRRKDMRAAP